MTVPQEHVTLWSTVLLLGQWIDSVSGRNPAVAVAKLCSKFLLSFETLDWHHRYWVFEVRTPEWEFAGQANRFGGLNIKSALDFAAAPLIQCSLKGDLCTRNQKSDDIPTANSKILVPADLENQRDRGLQILFWYNGKWRQIQHN